MKPRKTKKITALLRVPSQREMRLLFPASTDERIRHTAKTLGISMAEVVRQLVGKAIDEQLEVNPYTIPKKSKRRPKQMQN